MMEEYVLPLLLARRMGEVRGKTRFQKLLYIIQRRCQDRNLTLSVFSYEPYLYGPFSEELARTLDELVWKGLLGKKSDRTDAGYRVVIYGLTSKGKEFLEQMAATKMIGPRVMAVIDEVAKKEGGIPLGDLVAAAKAL